jgi:anti-sigma factor RsiW
MTHGQPHIEDGDLLRLMGDEVSADERAAAAAHLGRCAGCARRLEELRAELDQVTGLLELLPVAEIDADRRARSLAAVRQAAVRSLVTGQATGRVAARPSRRRFAFSSTLTRAAAAVVATLLLGTGVAASPAGAWIADLWRDLFQPEPAVVAAPEPTVLSVGGSVVGFSPVGDELVLELASAQETGSLTIRVEDMSSASARVLRGDEELDVVVLPSSLRILNQAHATADYEVVVPARMRMLRVRVGEAQELVLAPADLGAGWSVVVGLHHGGVDAQGGEL